MSDVSKKTTTLRTAAARATLKVSKKPIDAILSGLRHALAMAAGGGQESTDEEGNRESP